MENLAEICLILLKISTRPYLRPKTEILLESTHELAMLLLSKIDKIVAHYKRENFLVDITS